jgi:iron(III) transport system substrate-binding protein
MKKEAFMKKNILFLVILSFALSFLWGGVSLGAPEPQALRDVKDPTERTRIQGLIEGARAEGNLVWVGMMIEPQHAKSVMEGFKAYYDLPKLSIAYTVYASGPLMTQTEQLIQANRPTADIAWLVAWSWYESLIARGKLTRYDSPKYKEYTTSNKIGNSMPGYWVSDGYTFQPMWNVAAVEKAGIKNFNPTSWWDFTDPKLAKLTSLGNIGHSHPYASVAIGLKKVLGAEWFLKMAKNKPAIHTMAGQARDWVASGEFPIALFSNPKHAMMLKTMGVPVKLLYPKEGVVLLPFAPVILATGANPNAAKLFVDYVRSAEGTSRLAATGAGLLYGRPGVKGPAAEHEFLPDAADIKAIPMNWSLDGAEKAVTEMHEWVINIGLCY